MNTDKTIYVLIIILGGMLISVGAYNLFFPQGWPLVPLGVVGLFALWDGITGLVSEIRKEHK